MIDTSFLNQYPLFSYELFGNSVAQYFIAGVVILIVYSLLKLFQKRVVRNLHKLSERTATDFDDLIVDIIQSIGAPFYLFVSLGIGIQFIEQPEILKRIVSYVAAGVVIYTAVRIVQQIVNYVFQRSVKGRSETMQTYRAEGVS